jgi:hypothetical protein
MYAPCCRSSRASVGSTSVTGLEIFLALSEGTKPPQPLHWTRSLRPLPPLALPRLFLFTGNETSPLMLLTIMQLKNHSYMPIPSKSSFGQEEQ